MSRSQPGKLISQSLVMAWISLATSHSDGINLDDVILDALLESDYEMGSDIKQR